MSGAEEVNGNGLPFEWGKKRGFSKDKAVQFYGSFTYDGVEYSLYDHIFTFRHGLDSPFVGKIVKIWEAKKRRRIKVHWFFHPAEIAAHLGDAKPAPNELFLAIGDGIGASNVNELETIGGKCNVICTSKDERNPQPSQEDLKMADYIFYRTFDVGTLKISDKMGDSIQGVEVAFFFNRKEDKPASIVKIEDDRVDGHVAPSHSAPQVEEKSQTVQVQAPLDDSNDRPSKKPKVEELKKVKTEVNQQVKIEKSSADSGKATTTANRISNEKNKTDKISAAIDKKVMESVDLDSKQRKLPDGLPKKSKPSTSATVKDSPEVEKKPSENLKLDNKQTKRLDSLKKSVADSNVITDNKDGSEIAEVSRRPETDRSKWFADLPWDIKLKNAYDQDKLVMLDNLDPEYSQPEIEDLLYQVFKQNCSVRLIEQSSFTNPHHGQALVIFKTSDAAEEAVQRLSKEILMLPNGRPLIASKGITRLPDQKTSAIIGMLSLEKYTKQRKHKEDQRKAAFASHYSQANTIEYEMAIEWMLLHTKSKSWWDELHEANQQDIKKMGSSLKTR